MKDADNPEESEDGAKLPLAKKMLFYVDRIKIKSRESAELGQARVEMLKILIVILRIT